MMIWWLIFVDVSWCIQHCVLLHVFLLLDSIFFPGWLLGGHSPKTRGHPLFFVGVIRIETSGRTLEFYSVTWIQIWWFDGLLATKTLADEQNLDPMAEKPNGNRYVWTQFPNLTSFESCMSCVFFRRWHFFTSPNDTWSVKRDFPVESLQSDNISKPVGQNRLTKAPKGLRFLHWIPQHESFVAAMLVALGMNLLQLNILTTSIHYV